MNPDFPQTPREELEARLTALLLGELSAEEAAALRVQLAQDPELAALHQRLEQTIGLVREVSVSQSEPATAQAAPLRLSEERREQLLAEFKTIKPQPLLPPLPRRQRWLVPVAAAAMLLLLAAIVLPNFVRARHTSASNAVLNNLRQLDGAKQQWALEHDKSSADVPTVDDLKPYFKSGELPRPIAGESYVLGSVGSLPKAEHAETQSRSWFFGRAAAPRQQVAMLSDDNLGIVNEGLAAQTLSVRPKPATEPQPAPTRAEALFERHDSAVTYRSPSAQIVLPAPTEPEAAVPARAARDTSELGLKFRTWGLDGRSDSTAESRATTGVPLAWADSDSDRSLGLSPSADQPAAGAVADGFQSRYGLPAAPPQGAVRGRLAESVESKVAPLPALAPPPSPRQLTAGIAGAAPAYPTAESVPAPPGYPTFGELSVARKPVAKPEADKVPVLGDLPAMGGAFQMERPTVETRSVRVSGSEPVAPVAQPEPSGTKANEVLSFDDPGQAVLQASTARGVPLTSMLPIPRVNVERADSLATPGSPTPQDLYSAEVAGRTGSPVESYPVDLEAAKATLRRSQSSIVLPPTSAGAGVLNAGVARAGDALQDARVLMESGKAADAEVKLREVLHQNSGTVSFLSLAREPQQTDPSNLGEEGPRKGIAQIALADRSAVTVQPYFDKQRELAEAGRFGQLLTNEIASEGIDQTLPKGSAVQIVERAEAKTSESPTLLSRLGRVLSRESEATARVRIERDASHIAGFSENQSLGAYDPYFIQTEYEAIQSEAVLGKVVNGLKLDETWAEKRGGESLKKEEAIAMLRRQLDLRPVRDSGLVEIRAKGDKPEEAAQIANAVAEAYRDYRSEQARELAARDVIALQDRMAEQERKIVQTKAELERLGRQANIDADITPLRKPATNAPIPQPEVQTSENAYSTFSLNVSDVAFKLAAASLEQGQMPDPASVRAEEFINAFDYRDPEPQWDSASGLSPSDSASSLSAQAGKMLAPLAFAWERARYPFAHNRDLLRFSLKTGAVGRQAGRPLNVVLLLDNSGSMERADRVQIIREALRVLAGQLQPQDKLSVITFARTARLVADGLAGDKAGEVLDQVSGLTPQGGTNLEEAMNLAYATALRHYLAHGLNRIVLLTDGAANLGNVEPELLKHAVETHRKQGVALDCFGIGWEGLNDDLLEVLSRNGDGRYGFINSPTEAATEFAAQLAGALQVAASDVKVQVEFNPNRVTAYRQIGYARHQLTKEQFRDNTVDAAEIAAQEAGNALYTVAVNPAGEGPLGIVRVRFKIPGTTDYREHEWTVPCTGNAVSLEQASPAMRLAASASAFAEWLVVSPFAAEVSPDALLGYLSGVPEVYGADARPKKLEWMIRQAKSLTGK